MKTEVEESGNGGSYWREKEDCDIDEREDAERNEWCDEEGRFCGRLKKMKEVVQLTLLLLL